MALTLSPPASTSCASRKRPKIPSLIIPGTTLAHRSRTSTGLPHKSSLTSNVFNPIVTTTAPSATIALPAQGATMVDSSTDILAVADLFASLKRTLSTLNAAYDSLGTHTDKLAHLAPVMDVDQRLQEQISQQEKRMKDVQSLLDGTIQEDLIESLKAQIYDAISDSIAKEIGTQNLESEARRHNGSLRSSSMENEPLRPLLRPLPSALQSPAYTLSRPFTASNSTIASPMTPIPDAPVPTPMVTTVPAVVFSGGSKQFFELVPPTPSPLFPRDMKSLFALGPDAAKRLLNEYGLGTASATPSPSLEHAVKLVTDTGLHTPEVSPIVSSTSREEDINRFMAHIGVPLRMVPVPKPLRSGPRLHLIIP
ncbi:hypothetical protein H0H92_007931 [Tricholoma furcatifolium]|nr:hypothetical protein H0H92_007931 [Tricholoma furcatifolium]